LKGKVINPVLADVLNKYFFTKRGIMGPVLSKIFTYSKLMQFYNPIYLPMLDVYQAFWTGALTKLKTPLYFARALRSTIKKDQAYWDASYWGAFSTPYIPDFKTFDNQVKNIMIKNPFLRFARKYINPYQISWDAAWTADNFIRMIPYHYYISRGYSPREAAQLSAKSSGDYAAIPPSTRVFLNKATFTPSFRISMMAAQSQMADSLIKTITRGKVSMGIAEPGSKKYVKAMAGMAVGVASSVFLQEFIFHKLGFKTDQFGLRYVKDIEVEGEKKELVLYYPGPIVFLRYFHRFKTVLSTENPDKWDNLVNFAKWDLHPLWQLGMELISNKSVANEPIYNPFDSTPKITFDVLKYATKRIVRFTEIIPGMEAKEASRLQAYKSLIKDLGKVGAIVSWFSLPYIRNTKERRLTYQLNELTSLFKYYSEKKPFKTEADYEKAVEKLREKIDKISKELEQIHE
jgi:hypothetical protein